MTRAAASGKASVKNRSHKKGDFGGMRNCSTRTAIEAGACHWTLGLLKLETSRRPGWSPATAWTSDFELLHEHPPLRANVDETTESLLFRESFPKGLT